MPYGPTFEWKGYGARTRDRFFDTGYKQVARLAATIETFTGRTLESRRALDFGCGVGRMVIPLAERCEHVYGLDLAPSVLAEADRNAQSMNASNVEWLESGRLAELSGRYDAVMSQFVFQHIPVRQGERILATLLSGLTPGGVGAIQLILRPRRPLAGLFGREGRSVLFAQNPFKLIHGWTYMWLRSYSLNRLARLLAEAGISEWHVRYTPGKPWRSYESVNIVFLKQDPASEEIALDDGSEEAAE